MKSRMNHVSSLHLNHWVEISKYDWFSGYGKNKFWKIIFSLDLIKSLFKILLKI